MTQTMQDAVLDAERQRCAAMLAGDTAELGRLLDPRLHFSHANGMVDDKEAYLAKVKSGRIGYLSIYWSEQKLIPVGEAVLLSGRMSSLVKVDGVEKRLENRVLSLWAREDSWRLVAFQSTPLGK
jgi:Domain of unknown function (DUF4440)